MLKASARRTIRLLSATLFFVVPTVLLAACADQNAPTPPNSPPTSEYKALVVGDASSPVLEALKNQVVLTPYNGSQKVTDHDLLILDGDTHSPAALAEEALLKEAIDVGKWIMLLDASYEHKKRGAFPHIDFATQGDTDAFLFRQVPDTVMPTYDVLELPTVPPSAAVAPNQTPSAPDAKHQAFSKHIVEKLGAGACGSPLTIPEGAIFAVWCYGTPNDWSLASFPYGDGAIISGNTVNGHTVEPQMASNISNFVFTLLLNNINQATGDSQTLHVQVDGQMTPTTTVFPPGINPDITGKPYYISHWVDAGDYGEGVGYVQSELEVTLGPNDSSLTDWEPAAIFAPQTPNNTTTETFSSTTSFSLSATLNAASIPKPGGGGGVTGTYSVSNTQSRSFSVKDWTWTVGNTPNNSTYDWHFTSTNPKVGSWGLWNNNLNLLNQNLLGYGTAAVWTTCPNSTCAVRTDTLTFDVSSTQHVVGIYNFTGAVQLNQPTAQTLELDMSSVVPVTLKPASLTFADSEGNAITENNPIEAGEDVTATVELTGAAPFGYNISSSATSLNDNAVIVEDPIRIDKGDTKQIFTIETNDNDLRFDETVAVQISLGSFNSTASEQLWIQGPLLDTSNK